MAKGLSGRNFRKPVAALECFFSTMYTTLTENGSKKGVREIHIGKMYPCSKLETYFSSLLNQLPIRGGG